MTIVPDTDPGVPSSPDIVERMSRADACPDCVGNVEAPYRTEDEGAGFRAYYLCADCGHLWMTSWIGG